MSNRKPLITVEQLIRELSFHDKDARVEFSGLDFMRVKSRGDDLVQIEFDQQVYRDSSGNVVVQNLE